MNFINLHTVSCEVINISNFSVPLKNKSELKLKNNNSRYKKTNVYYSIFLMYCLKLIYSIRHNE